MHSPPSTIAGEPETMPMVVRPSSRMLKRRWRKISYLMGSTSWTMAAFWLLSRFEKILLTLSEHVVEPAGVHPLELRTEGLPSWIHGVPAEEGYAACDLFPAQSTFDRLANGLYPIFEEA